MTHKPRRNGDSNETTIRLRIEALEEGGYVATSPDVPGLVAEGRSVTEAVEIAQGLTRTSGAKDGKGIRLWNSTNFCRRSARRFCGLLGSMAHGACGYLAPLRAARLDRTATWT